MKPRLTTKRLKNEAASFSESESKHAEPSLFGVTDGKAVGTYLEHKFQKTLHAGYNYVEGSSAKGIDFPVLKVDMKVTSIRQPQSSCPFKSARQKIFGLGYSLLVFVYDKTDDQKAQTSTLHIRHNVFIQSDCTADYQTTTGIREILQNNGNADDLVAFMTDRNLPVDEIEALKIAEDLMRKAPKQGYLTISSALQWRLQYSRVIEKAGSVSGILRLR